MTKAQKKREICHKALDEIVEESHLDPCDLAEVYYGISQLAAPGTGITMKVFIHEFAGWLSLEKNVGEQDDWGGST